MSDPRRAERVLDTLIEQVGRDGDDRECREYLATLRRKAALADRVIEAAGCGVPVDWPLVIARWNASFAAGAGEPAGEGR